MIIRRELYKTARQLALPAQNVGRFTLRLRSLDARQLANNVTTINLGL